MKFTSLILMLILFLCACSDDNNEKSVSRSEFGDRWPLTVEEGSVKCLSNGSVIFTANGIEYGVNGYAKARGFTRIDIIWAENTAEFNKMAEEISAVTNEPLSEVKESLGSVHRFDISPILDLGLSLCDK